MKNELEQLEKTIAALEAQRAILGEDVVETALAPLRQKLAALQAGEQPAPPVEEPHHPEAKARDADLINPEKPGLAAQQTFLGQHPPGGEQALAEQRKLVTVLFADLVDFTPLAEQLDPEDVREILNAYFSRWTGCIEQFGGLVEKFIGDAVMAVFGMPTAHEDDPENAIRAALAMRSTLEILNEDMERIRGIRLAMRVGIHTGPVVVSYLGERKGQDVVVVGDTVNLTSRLQAIAPPGGIFISHDTYRHVRGVFDIQALEPVKVKGKKEPIQVYQVLLAKPRAFRMTTRGVEGIETHMVGRQAEFMRLQDALYTTIEKGELQMIAVVGEAGIGKSRLLAEFDNWAELLPQRIYYFKGRATATMQNQGNSLLRDLFSFRFQIQESDPPYVVYAKMEAGIAEFALPISDLEPEHPDQAEIEMRSHFVGQLLGFDFSSSLYLSSLQQNNARSDNTKQVRDRALVYLIDFFKALSAQGPVVILLEDLHWADDSSLDILLQLTHTLAFQPIFVLCTTRRSLFDRRPEWKNVIELRQHIPTYNHLDLQPLSRRDTHKLIEEILQKVEKIPGELHDLIVSSAEGNPFYVEELTKMLIEDKVILKETENGYWQVDITRLAGVRVPPTLIGVLQARFESLPSGERLLLQRASVIGRIFWDDALAALSGDRRPEIRDSTQLSISLNALRNREMIYPHERSAFEEIQEYLFKHALFRDVTYESLLKRERRIYHLHAAQWLEWVTQRSQRSDEYASVIAEHYDHAGESGQAAGWYLRAGKQAAAQYANAEALRLLDRALEFTPQDETSLLFEILLARVKVFSLMGKREAQSQDQDALAALAEQMNDDTKRAEAALLRSRLSEATGEYSQAVEYARQAVNLAKRSGEVEKAANGFLLWGSALWRKAEYEPARIQFEQALELSQNNDLHGVEADALRSLGIIYEVQSDFAHARHYLERSLDLYRITNDRRGESMSQNSLGVMILHLGDLSKARQLLDSAFRLKREIGDRYGEGVTLTNLGIIAQYQGDVAGAHAYFERCLQICIDINDREGEAAAVNGLGTMAMYVGDYHRAKDLLEQALAICQQIGDRQGGSGILAALGQLCNKIRAYKDARSYSQQALAIAEEMDGQSEAAYALTSLGHAYHGLRRLDEAFEAYQRAYQIRQGLALSDLLADDLAGMAQVALDRRELIQAHAYIEQILDYLSIHPDANMDDPASVYLTCLRVLEAAGDSRAQAILEVAYAWLQERAARILDEETRASFLWDVPANREIAAEWEKRTYQE